MEQQLEQQPGTSPYPIAIAADQVPPRTKRSLYPEPFATQMEKRQKTVLGDLFGLRNFGVNLTRIHPGGCSALRHAHTTQDEFIYVLAGQPTLITNAGEQILEPGMCAGFRAGSGDAHQLVNRTDQVVVYLEVGDRSPGDAVTYPDDDLQANFVNGQWQFSHKDGQAY